MVSALTLLGAEDTPSATREQWSYVLLAEELRRVSAEPRKDAKELFRRMCFNALISNTDDHPRNHDGEYFSVLVTRTVANPKPGSDEIKKAFEESWVGINHNALAFQGHVVTVNNKTISEVFIVELPDDLTQPGDGPLAGTETRMPCPPKGCVQRRLTLTAERKFPGIQGPRHWLRSSPDGSRIAFFM